MSFQGSLILPWRRHRFSKADLKDSSSGPARIWQRRNSCKSPLQRCRSLAQTVICCTFWVSALLSSFAQSSMDSDCIDALPSFSNGATSTVRQTRGERTVGGGEDALGRVRRRWSSLGSSWGGACGHFIWKAQSSATCHSFWLLPEEPEIFWLSSEEVEND